MPLYIRNDEVDRRARELAARTGETMTAAVGRAIEERLARIHAGAGSGATPLARSVDEIQRRVASLPVLDERTPDEILGYGPEGTAG